MITIGSQIEKILREKRMSVSEFAKKINTNRNNVYHIFNRKTIDTGLLEKISNVLGYNFFKSYNSNLSDESIINENNDENLKIISELKIDNKILKKEIDQLKKEIQLKDKIIDLLENNKKKKYFYSMHIANNIFFFF